MSTPSAVPAAIDALVALFAATLGAERVFDGPGARDTGEGSYVFVGVGDPDDDGYDDSASGDQSWAWLGHVQRDETFSVHCCVIAWNGDGDQKAARDEAFAIVGKVTDALQADPTLGGVLLYAPGVKSYGLRQIQDGSGAATKLPFDVECRARLS